MHLPPTTIATVAKDDFAQPLLAISATRQQVVAAFPRQVDVNALLECSLGLSIHAEACSALATAAPRDPRSTLKKHDPQLFHASLSGTAIFVLVLYVHLFPRNTAA